MSSVRIERDVSGDAEAAFHAFTRAEILRRWWWPQLPDTAYAVDPVVGGELRVVSAAAGIGFRGSFSVVDPPKRLAFTFIWLTDGADASIDEEPVVDEVEVTFEPLGASSTRVRVVHRSVQEVSETEGVGQGWHDVMDRLAALPL